MKLQEGQCGLCKHFGEDHPQHVQTDITQIRNRREVRDPEFKEECGHPQHLPLHLLVTATSGCDGFEPAGSQ